MFFTVHWLGYYLMTLSDNWFKLKLVTRPHMTSKIFHLLMYGIIFVHSCKLLLSLKLTFITWFWFHDKLWVLWVLSHSYFLQMVFAKSVSSRQTGLDPSCNHSNTLFKIRVIISLIVITHHRVSLTQWLPPYWVTDIHPFDPFSDL